MSKQKPRVISDQGEMQALFDGRGIKVISGQFIKTNDDGTVSVHDVPEGDLDAYAVSVFGPSMHKAWANGYRKSCQDHGDGGKDHGSHNINPYPADPVEYDEGDIRRVAQMPAVVAVKAMLDALAVDGRVDSHAHSELMSLLDDIPDCESVTAVPHEEHESPDEDAPRTSPSFDVSRLPVAIRRCPAHHIPDCSPLLNGCSWGTKLAHVADSVIEVHEREKGHD